MVASVFLMHLEVLYVVFVGNAPGQSTYNPVEHIMAPLSLILMVLAVYRDKPKEQIIEDKIRKYRSVKKFVDEFKDTHSEYVSVYEQTIEILCSLIEDAFGGTRYVGSKIKIGEPFT